MYHATHVSRFRNAGHIIDLKFVFTISGFKWVIYFVNFSENSLSLYCEIINILGKFKAL